MYFGLVVLVGSCVFSGSLSFLLGFDVVGVGVGDLVDLVMYFDLYSLLRLLLLFVVVCSVHLFTLFYMVGEVNLFRFILVLKGFVVSMVFLIVSPNLFLFLLGWDWLGFISFVLIIWYSCFSRRKGGLKTFLRKRVGDCFFVVSFVFFFRQGGFGLMTIDFVLFVVGVFVAIGAITKRAQFPFRRWLSVAMMAPTPISALVHSSTLVISGLYFLFRFFELLDRLLLFFLCFVGLWTVYVGRLGAMFACDVKKVVAFSTLRQMGFVLVVLCFGLLEFGFYYLVVHGLFKALMFISVGCLMVLVNHKQDFRILSGVWVLSPFVSLRLFVRVFSLSGLPFLSGFYVKDVILGKFLFFPRSGVFGVGFFFAVFLTVVYSFRLFSVLFLGMKKFFCALNSTDMLVLIFFPLYGVLMFFGYYGFVFEIQWLKGWVSLFQLVCLFLVGLCFSYYYNVGILKV